MRSPSASADASGLRNTTPAPSPRTYPFARASNAKHWPLGETIAALLKPTVACGVMTALTPPTSAAAHCPAQMLWQASQTATAPEEHAVSTDRLGPLRSSM